MTSLILKEVLRPISTQSHTLKGIASYHQRPILANKVLLKPNCIHFHTVYSCLGSEREVWSSHNDLMT